MTNTTSTAQPDIFRPADTAEILEAAGWDVELSDSDREVTARNNHGTEVEITFTVSAVMIKATWDGPDAPRPLVDRVQLAGDSTATRIVRVAILLGEPNED